MKLTIKGKEYGLHFGIGAAEIAADVLSTEEKPIDANDVFFNSVLIDLQTGGQQGVSLALLFGAVLNWCDENDVKYEGTFSNFRNAYNEFSPEYQKEILAEYRKAYHGGKLVGEIFDELLKSYETNKPTESSKKKVTRSKKSSETSSSGASMTIVE
jgi:hypothetical protein